MEGEVNVNAVLQDHESRITNLEREFTNLEKGMLRIENTVMSEGKEQRSLINKMLENQFQLNKRKLTSSEKVKIATISMVGTILGGGALVGIISLFVK